MSNKEKEIRQKIPSLLSGKAGYITTNQMGLTIDDFDELLSDLSVELLEIRNKLRKLK